MCPNKVAIFYAEGSAVALHPEFGRAPEDPTGMSHGTLYRIKERFMWHDMVKDVVSLVSSLFNWYALMFLFQIQYFCSYQI